MNERDGTKGKSAEERRAEARKARLAEQLRINLLRRKQQARARRAGEADKRQGIDGGSSEGSG